jgi:hypothetical protein
MLVTDWKVSNNPYRCGSDELRDNIGRAQRMKKRRISRYRYSCKQNLTRAISMAISPIPFKFFFPLDSRNELGVFPLPGCTACCCCYSSYKPRRTLAQCECVSGRSARRNQNPPENSILIILLP